MLCCDSMCIFIALCKCTYPGFAVNLLCCKGFSCSAWKYISCTGLFGDWCQIYPHKLMYMYAEHKFRLRIFVHLLTSFNSSSLPCSFS